MVHAFQRLRSRDEPRLGDFPILHFVDGHEFDLAGAFREGASNELVIDDSVAHHDAVEELCVEIRFGEPECKAFAQLRRTAGEKFGGVLELLGVLGICGEEGFDVVRIVGVELALDDDGGRRGIIDHSAFLLLDINYQRAIGLRGLRDEFLQIGKVFGHVTDALFFRFISPNIRIYVQAGKLLGVCLFI